MRKIAFLLFTALTAIAAVAQTDTLDLTSGEPVFKNKAIKVNKFGNSYEIVSKAEIVVTDFLLTKDGEEKKDFFVNSLSGTLVHPGKAKKDFPVKDGAKFDPSKSYTITFGDKTWDLIIYPDEPKGDITIIDANAIVINGDTCTKNEEGKFTHVPFDLSSILLSTSNVKSLLIKYNGTDLNDNSIVGRLITLKNEITIQKTDELTINANGEEYCIIFDEKAQKGGGWLWWILGGAGVLLIACGAGAFYWFKRRKPKTPQKTDGKKDGLDLTPPESEKEENKKEENKQTETQNLEEREPATTDNEVTNELEETKKKLEELEEKYKKLEQENLELKQENGDLKKKYNEISTPQKDAIDSQEFVAMLKTHGDLFKKWNNNPHNEDDMLKKISKFFAELDALLYKGNGTSMSNKEIVDKFKEIVNTVDARTALDETIIPERIKYLLDLGSVNPRIRPIVEAYKASQKPVKSDEEVVAEVIGRNGLTEAHRKELLKIVVDNINKRAPEANAINATNFDTLYKLLADALAKPDTPEGAMDSARRKALKEISDALGTRVDVEDNECIDEIKTAINNGRQATQEMKQLGVNKVSEMASAIKEREVAEIKKSTASQLPDGVDLGDCTSAQKIANRLISAANKAIDDKKKTIEDKEASEQLVMETIQEDYNKITGNTLPATDSPASALALYQKEVATRMGELDKRINEQDTRINELNSEVTLQASSIKTQKTIIDGVSTSLKNAFLHGVEQLEECMNSNRFMVACDHTCKQLCSDNIERLKQAFEQFSDAAGDVLGQVEAPQEIKDAVVKFLENELANENGFINLETHYYAYSRMAFMTDNTRTYGVYFNRTAMTQLHEIVENLLADFGLQLIVPTLFSERVNEGNFEDCTGKEYGDLDNICPQSVNYKENIPNPDKSGVIIDMLQPGYNKNGKLIKKAKVII